MDNSRVRRRLSVDVGAMLFDSGVKRRSTPPLRSVATDHSFLSRSVNKKRSIRDMIKDAYVMSQLPENAQNEANPISKTASLLPVFRRIVNLTIFCIRQTKLHSIRHCPEIETENKSKTLSDLSFDVSVFRANKQDRISEETKKILASSPGQRSNQDLNMAQISLRCIRAFAEYPVRMQSKIVRVGMYEQYGDKRVIVRQGHPAFSFYFILSGTVVVMVMNEDRKSSRPVAYLQRGQTFGELAIIHRGTRQSTIISDGAVEFLTISVDDFHSIFMDGGVKNLNDPDHNNFLRSLDFLDGWPIHILVQQQQKCVFHFFKRGDLLVTDSLRSDWLIIVKSGSLTVLKKLQKVRPFCALTSEGKRPSLVPKHKQLYDKVNERRRWRQSILPEINIPLSDDTEDVDRELSLPFKHQPGNSHTTIHHNISCLINPKRCQQNRNTKAHLENKRKVTLPPIENRRADSSHVSKLAEIAKEEYPKIQDADHKSRVRTRDNSKDELPSTFQQHVRTINEDLDSGRYAQATDDNMEEKLHPEFVRVSTLTKGQVFGLTDMLFDQQPSLSVISNAAECILIDKSLYWEHTPERLRRKLRKQIRPYPSDVEMQDELQVKVNWQSFRSTTLQGAVTLAHTKRKSLTIG